MSSTALSVSVTRSEEFFFVSTVLGFAEVIISPAFWAMLRRKSWISCRFGSSILRDGGDRWIGWWFRKRERVLMLMVALDRGSVYVRKRQIWILNIVSHLPVDIYRLLNLRSVEWCC